MDLPILGLRAARKVFSCELTPMAEKKEEKEEKEEKKEEKEVISKGVSEVMKALTGDVSLGIDALKKIVHTKSTSHIQSSGSGRGFNHLNMSTKCAQGVTDTRAQAVSCVESWISQWEVTPDAREGAASALSAFLSRLHQTRTLTEQVMAIQFNQGRGMVLLVFFTLAYLPADDGWQYVLAGTSGSFGLAPDFVVMRETHDGFFSSSSRDVIHYVPRGITGADVTALLMVALEPLGMSFLEQRQALANANKEALQSLKQQLDIANMRKQLKAISETQ